MSTLKQNPFVAYADTDSLSVNESHKQLEIHFNDSERAKFNWLVNMRHYSVDDAIKSVLDERNEPEWIDKYYKM